MRVKITGIGISDGHFLKRNDYIGMIGNIVPERIHPDGSLRGKFEEEGTGKCLFFNKVMYEKEKYKPKKEGAMKKMRCVKDLFIIGRLPEERIFTKGQDYEVISQTTDYYFLNNNSGDQYAVKKDHGYFLPVEERMYSVGQKIVIRNHLGVDFYVISQRPSVSLRHGNGNWRRPIQVKDINYITQAEMDRMVDPADFGGVVGDDEELPF